MRARPRRSRVAVVALGAVVVVGLFWLLTASTTSGGPPYGPVLGGPGRR